MKHQSFGLLSLSPRGMLLQYFLSMNQPQKQSNSDGIAAITDWPQVSCFFAASCSGPDKSANEICDELSLSLGHSVHFHTDVITVNEKADTRPFL